MCVRLVTGGRGFDSLRVQHSFVGIDLEIFSTGIISLLLFKEGQSSVSWRKNMHKSWLTAKRTKPTQDKNVVR